MPRQANPQTKIKNMQYVNRWMKENKVRVTTLLDKAQDIDLLNRLESVPNKSEYIKNLIRKDLETQADP